MLAIVIPYFNFYFFDETLKSLSLQTDKRFTVYIGNDNSLDSPHDIIFKYESILRIKYKKFDENLGSVSLTSQWERCISLIDNELWIMVLGDDDILDKNCVASFYKNLEQIKKYNVIRFASRYINSFGDPLPNYNSFFHPTIEKSTDSFCRNFLGQSRSSLSEHIFSRSSYEKFKFYDYPLAWHSDDRAWLEFSGFKEIFTINEALVSIRVSEKSITGKKDNISLKRKARMLFLKYLIEKKWAFFTDQQRRIFLFDYGVLLKESKEVTTRSVFFVISRFCFMGDFYNALRFIRRIYWIK